MIKSSVVANLLVSLYNGAADFDILEPGSGDSGICWAAKEVDGVTLLLLRGSVTLSDWLDDFRAVTTPFNHSVLGPVHPGFALGMTDCWAEMRAKTKGPYVISGHSLGAGRAAILTGLMIRDGILPQARIAFGEPKPGFAQLARYIAPVPAVSYRNVALSGPGHDYVTDVPATFPLENYTHPCPLTSVRVKPSSNGLFAFHHMPLYAQAVADL